MAEHFVFRGRLNYDVLVWDSHSFLPAGIAAFFAWACGLTAALMGADQSWLVGPIAKAIGGADIGWELVSQSIFPRSLRYGAYTDNFALSRLPLLLLFMFLREWWS
jgi:purine-cytosine permease-like protein